MDKIQELHKELGEKEYGNVWPEGHASITEDMMGKFAEWVDMEGWTQENYNKGEWMKYVGKEYLEVKSTTELIQLFKETL